MLGNPMIEIIPAQVVVPGHSLNLNHLLKTLHHRHIQRTSAQIHHQKRRILLPALAAAGQGRRGRLVDQAFHPESGHLTGFLCGKALLVVKIGGHADHRLLHLAAQILLRVLLQLL